MQDESAMGKFERADVSFPVEVGIQLSGWIFVPEGSGPFPTITMSHGYAGCIYHGLEPFAAAFASAGFVVLVYDHRGFGKSGGIPREDINPWQQIADSRRAMSPTPLLLIVARDDSTSTASYLSRNKPKSKTTFFAQ